MKNKKKYNRKQRFLLLLADRLGPFVIKFFGKSCRYSVEGKSYWDHAIAAKKGVIAALWHGRMLLPIYYHRNDSIVSLVSLHFDGEIITRIVNRLGFVIRRGSPREGGREGFLAILNDLRQGKTVAMFPDGPTGPRHLIHDGVIHLARLTGAPMIPLLFSANPAWRVHSWDRFMIPKPFSRGVIKYGEPFFIPRNLKPGEEFEQKKEEFRNLMIEMEKELDLRMGVTEN